MLLWLLVAMAVPRGAAAGYRADFVLDAEDAVRRGAVLLSTEHAQSPESCESACNGDQLCNLALVEPNNTCALFDCVYRNRFVCNRFQSSVTYLTYVTEKVYETYLKAPPRIGEQLQPIAFGGRDVVVQPGETVVLNGSESLAPGNEIQNYDWTLIKGNDGVTTQPGKYRDQIQVSGLESGSYLFKLTVTDSNGNSNSDVIVVQVLTPEQTGLFCLAPVKVGPCRAAFIRWSYDAVSGVCRNFTYGGCRGNYNNFLTQDACQTACRGVTASLERSAPPPATSVCGAACSDGQLVCDSTCCVHKSLECDGVTQCSDGADERDCSKLNQTFNELVNIEVDEKKARCTLPPRTGPCRASLTRWFYDPLQQKCQTFIFGGCDANGNNYDTEPECEESCRGVTEEDVYSPGMFKRFGEEDESESGSIALAVILTVAVLALLAIAAYCFIRKKKDRGHIPVSPTDDQA